MATISATTLAEALKTGRGQMPADYSQRLALAVAEFSRGRRWISDLASEGRVVRMDHGYAPADLHAESCCFDFHGWDSVALPTHFASAKHIANHYRVGRLDLLHAIDAAYVSGHLRLLRGRAAS